MPEYDPTHPPKPMADAILPSKIVTHAEAGRDVPTPDPANWPSSNMLNDPYSGPPASREYETAVLGGRSHSGRALPPDPHPVEQRQAPTDPLPGARS